VALSKKASPSPPVEHEDAELPAVEGRAGAPELTVDAAIVAYRDRAEATDAVVRAMPLDAPCGWELECRCRSRHRIDHTPTTQAVPGGSRS
jgi:hypothetical protein